MRTAQDLPQPLLWPQLQGAKVKNHIPVINFRFHQNVRDWFLPGGGVWSGKTLATLPLAELAKQLIDEGYQVVLFGSGKIMRRAMRFLPL